MTLVSCANKCHKIEIGPVKAHVVEKHIAGQKTLFDPFFEIAAHLFSGLSAHLAF